MESYGSNFSLIHISFSDENTTHWGNAKKNCNLQIPWEIHPIQLSHHDVLPPLRMLYISLCSSAPNAIHRNRINRQRYARILCHPSIPSDNGTVPIGICPDSMVHRWALNHFHWHRRANSSPDSQDSLYCPEHISSSMVVSACCHVLCGHDLYSPAIDDDRMPLGIVLAIFLVLKWINKILVNFICSFLSFSYFEMRVKSQDEMNVSHISTWSRLYVYLIDHVDCWCFIYGDRYVGRVALLRCKLQLKWKEEKKKKKSQCSREQTSLNQTRRFVLN